MTPAPRREHRRGLTDIAVLYIVAIYESVDGDHTGHSRVAGARGAALGVRHQGGSRSLHALLLGGELRADLPGAQAARARGPGRGRGFADRRSPPPRLPV